MEAAVVGCGRVGMAIARRLGQLGFTRITLIDASLESAERAAELAGAKARAAKVDAADLGELSSVLEGHDVACVALPGSVGPLGVSAGLRAGVSVVDVSYSDVDPFSFSSLAHEREVAFVPDCGVAPGLSNILAGRAESKLGELEELKIYVGGIPARPEPPLEYCITWSVEDLIEEYTRPARIVADGRVAAVEPLSGLEEVEFPSSPPLRLEAFYTDGLRTLIKTIKARRMFEKTLRYPGHAAKIKLLRELGLMSSEAVEVSGVQVRPRDLLAELLKRRLKPCRDMVLLMVEARGAGGRARFTMVDEYSEAEGLSAMARTTGYTAASVALLVAEGEVEAGVVPPEELGKREGLYTRITRLLAESGIEVFEEVLSP
ncbi:MAG: saccharopine dehydrogenase family protein [Thermoproteota archaeon]|nr:MAG: saccharopine dehydrogenase family protein [Candidatus Korarchaeota archaeon]